MDNSYLLKLHSNIDLNEIKKMLKQKTKYRPIHKSHFEEDQEIVYTILHKFSNYENVIWSMYMNKNREFVHKCLNQILLDISKLDSSLTWACMKIFKRYKREYNSRKKRSSYVENISYQSVEL
tara:strand:+ start:195 stop:563 length:369 start_codon:yes stop_codon:yes gene_type:complete